MAKVVVGMSGGVDSAVAAYLLKREGHEVVGVTLRTFYPKEGECPGADDARRVAEKIGIPYLEKSCAEDFRRSVEDPFVREYVRGRTPNPCVVCNRLVKWEKLLEVAGELQADYIATGHYARIERLPNGRLTVRQALHAAKDQTYMLYRLTQEQLAKTLMPLGGLSKAEVRTIAREAGLPVASKPDSQEICFVPDNDYAAFVLARAKTLTWPSAKPCPPDQASSLPNAAGSAEAPSLPNAVTASVAEAPSLPNAGVASVGNIPFSSMPAAGVNVFCEGNYVDEDGKILGKHRGIVHYTVGQRKGLGIALGHPVYVTRINPERNEVVLGTEEALFHRVVLLEQVNFMGVTPPALGESFSGCAKVRYHHAPKEARVLRTGVDELEVVFEEPVKAPAPGQSAVIYDGEGHVLCGGIIREAWLSGHT